MKRIARSTYRLIYAIPLVVLFLILLAISAARGPSAGNSSAFSFFAATFFIWLLIGRRVAVLLLPVLISRVKCPGCGEEISPVGIWNCGCGFHAHRERHILSGSCPKCGNRTGHLNCPRCDCTILLW